MKRIMVVDGTETVLRKASGVLAAAGHEVVTAKDGLDAIAKMADFRPDLLFIDIRTPGIDGYQTCSLVKNHGRHGGMPVILLSGKGSPFDRAHGRVVGAEGHIRKPFGEADLLDAVEAHATPAGGD